MTANFKTDREKLDRIQQIVNNALKQASSLGIYDALVTIDSICDVPLFGDEF